jgi:hypothetical protein
LDEWGTGADVCGSAGSEEADREGIGVNGGADGGEESGIGEFVEVGRTAVDAFGFLV